MRTMMTSLVGIMAVSAAHAQTYPAPTFQTAYGIIGSGITFAGLWATTGRPTCNATVPTAPLGTPGGVVSTGRLGSYGFNTTAQGLDVCTNAGWITLLAGGGGGGAVSSVSATDGSLISTPTTGAVTVSLNVAHANTWTANQTFATGGGTGTELFSSNLGSPHYGAIYSNETAWTPAAVLGGTGASPGNNYDSLVLTGVGLTNRGGTSASDWFNTFVHARYTSVSTTTNMANAHLSGDINYMYYPSGLGDGCNGGTASAGVCVQAQFSASITASTMTVVGSVTGTIAVGQNITSGAAPGTIITASLGGGVYLLNQPQTTNATPVRMSSTDIWTGGVPGLNANYQENTNYTGVTEMGSPGMYCECIASYAYDHLVAVGATFTGTISGTNLTVSGLTGSLAPGQTILSGAAAGTYLVSGSGTSWIVSQSQSVGPIAMTAEGVPNSSRVTGFLSAIYKNSPTNYYQTWGFAAASVGNQQGAYAPTSAFSVVGGWQYGLDMRFALNVPGLVAIAFTNQNYITFDATDIYIGVNNTQIAMFNTTTVDFSVPLTFASQPTGAIAGAACFTSGFTLIDNPSGNCYTGSGGGSVTLVATGTGLTGGPITGAGTVSIAATAVTPGTYTVATITVNQQGQITSAATGSTSGGVTSITCGTDLTGGTITTTGTCALSPTISQDIEFQGSGTGVVIDHAMSVAGFSTMAGASFSADVAFNGGGTGATFTASVAIGTGSGGSGVGLAVTNQATFGGDVLLNGAGTGLSVSAAAFVGGLIHGAQHAEFDGSVYLSTAQGSGSAIAGTSTDFQVYIASTQLVDMNTSAATFSVSPNTAGGIIYYSQGTPGVGCSGTPTAGFLVLGGIVVHC